MFEDVDMGWEVRISVSKVWICYYEYTSHENRPGISNWAGMEAVEPRAEFWDDEKSSQHGIFPGF